MTTERKQDTDDFAVFMEDFHHYTAGDWIVSTVELGAGSATEAITPGAGGVLLLTNAAGDNDHDFLQSAEVFKYTSGKAWGFKSRLKVSDATESDFVVGLQITDTTPLDVTDGIFFQKDDGDTNLDFHVEKNGTASSESAIATVADDTWMTVEAYHDGDPNHKIQVYVNDVLVAGVALTNIPDDEDLAVSFGIQNGAAAAKTMSIDYFKVWQER